MNVTVWNENLHEQTSEAVRAVHPHGIHNTLADFLKQQPDMTVRTATLDMPDCGLPDDVLDSTDVLLWWGHMGHDRVPDELAQKVADRVRRGMGLIVLHSAHYSKVFRLLMGTTCSLRWRDGDFERLWCMDPSHPLSAGLPAMFTLDVEEMYGEAFDVPTPDSVVYGGWFRGGELFRSVCCWTRGAGKVVYIQPGHETNPSYHNPHIQQLIINAVRFSQPVRMRTTLGCFHTDDTTEQRLQNGLSMDEYQY